MVQSRKDNDQPSHGQGLRAAGKRQIHPVGSLLLRNIIQEGHRLLSHTYLKQDFVGMKTVTLHDLQVLCGTSPLHTQDGQACTVAIAPCSMSPCQGLAQTPGHTERLTAFDQKSSLDSGPEGFLLMSMAFTLVCRAESWSDWGRRGVPWDLHREAQPPTSITGFRL